jgi:diaminopropionate ammonia-lyase
MTRPVSVDAREDAVALLCPRAAGSLKVAPPPDGPRRFHATMPGYAPTPLRDAPAAAARLRVNRVLVKDESSRLGLASFKVLGASWAVFRALVDRLGSDPASVRSFAELKAAAADLAPFTLSAATDGNHGHAVARMAALLGLAARVYVPANTVQARIDAIAAEGATVTVVAGGYEHAVRRSAEDAGERCLVISDTSWEGYTAVPAWVIEGYSTILAEVEDALRRADSPPRPDVVIIPIGVGALAASVVAHFWAAPEPRPLLVGVEPTSAACVLESVAAGRVSTLDHEQDSIMAGLNCATPSLVAWPVVSRGIDVYLAVHDGWVPEAMRLLARDGIVAGETGAAGLAGMLALLDDPSLAPARAEVALGPDTTVLLLCTEGATDPDAYRRLVGDRGP